MNFTDEFFADFHKLVSFLGLGKLLQNGHDFKVVADVIPENTSSWFVQRLNSGKRLFDEIALILFAPSSTAFFWFDDALTTLEKFEELVLQFLSNGPLCKTDVIEFTNQEVFVDI